MEIAEISTTSDGLPTFIAGPPTLDGLERPISTPDHLRLHRISQLGLSVAIERHVRAPFHLTKPRFSSRCCTRVMDRERHV
jgi:hypothetical protein